MPVSTLEAFFLGDILCTEEIGPSTDIRNVNTDRLIGYWHQRADERHGKPPPRESKTHSRTLIILIILGCASGCVVECRICNREVAGSNLGLGYFAPRSTQPIILPWSVNEYQLWLGRQRQV